MRMLAAVQRVYGSGASAARIVVQLSDPERSRIKADCGSLPPATFTYQSISVAGKRAGYSVVDNVRGKSQLITYALMVGPGIEVRDLEVLVYREPYGGEIANEAFRRQFRGKQARDNVSIGRGIRNISGATISSNAVTNGTRRLLAILQVLKDGGRLQ